MAAGRENGFYFFKGTTALVYIESVAGVDFRNPVEAIHVMSCGE